MGAADELAWLDATAQAELVTTGQATPAELVDAAIDRIERLNPEINALVEERFDSARAEARSPDLSAGPFRGVPFLLKDIGATQAGTCRYLGNRALKALDLRSESDTVLGARFREAGFVTVGKTNLPELGSCPTTQPLAFGPTHNPWDPTRSPSGSSGGSAAAVASGMVPVAHANDGGGSTRLPAAWCGLVGLKTTRGRMPQPDAISRLVSELVVSRTVRDTAAVLDVTLGHTDADLYQLPYPERCYVDELERRPEPLRVGLLTDGGEVAVDDECVAGAEAAATLLAEMGHRVEPVTGDVLFGGDGDVNGTLWMAGIARRVESLGELAGRPLTADEVDPYNWVSAERGKDVTASEWTAAQEQQQAWAARVIEWSSQYDLLVTPTSGAVPMRTEDLWPDPDKPWRIGRTYGKIGRFTLPFNATGQPAISLPLHWTDDGLPVGVHLVAGMGREDLLLQVAAALEEAAPWAHRRPIVAA